MQLLSKTECSALRGFAILGIFLHNYLHWLAPMVQENEYLFKRQNVDRLMDLLATPAWELPLQLFSFFGHYGVPVFLFLSGYGLVMKYEQRTEDGMLPREDGTQAGGAWGFIWHHYKKLFPMMFLGFVLFAMVDWITPGHHHWSWDEVLAQLTMTVNFLAHPDRVIWPGPYWFFGLMMQLYIVYRLVLYRRHWGWAAGLVALSWIVQSACMGAPESETLNRIRYNCIGGLLPFCVGILVGRCGNAGGWMQDVVSNKVSCAALTVVCIAMIVLFSCNFHTWLWVPLLVVMLHVTAVKVLPQAVMQGLAWLGGLSAAVFVCHPITRKVFIPISRQGDVLDGLVLYIAATLLLAMLFRMIITNLKKQ